MLLRTKASKGDGESWVSVRSVKEVTEGLKTETSSLWDMGEKETSGVSLRSWGDDSVVKNPSCSTRGLGFDSQDPHEVHDHL